MENFKEVEIRIGKLARFLDYLVVELPRKWRKQVKILAWIVILNFAVAVSELVGFSYYILNDLMRLLVQFEIIAVDLLAMTCFYTMVTKKTVYISCFSWCREKHLQKEGLEGRLIKNHFKKASEDSLKAIQFWTFLITATYLLVLPLHNLARFALGHPFPLPFLFNLPFLPVSSVWSYLANLVHQYLAALFVHLVGNIGLQILSIVLLHLYAYLCSLHEAIQDMRAISQETSFLEWYGLVHSMIVEEKRVFGAFTEAQHANSYILEKVSYASLFVTWLVFNVSKQDIFYSVLALIIVFMILVVCIINEVFKDKYEDICEAIYDSPWYELSPKEQKLLIPLLAYAQDYRGIEAGGIRSMTFEYFTDLVNAGYSTGLVLEKMITA